MASAYPDHRDLGRDLDLFLFHPAAPGAPFWTHRGTLLFHLLAQAMRNLCLSNGYQEIKTPLMYDKSLWEQSGHWGKYKENMFQIVDPEEFSLKPMNCPSHFLFYQAKKHSYRELPLRYHSQDVLHRNEASGVLSGLTRVRQFQQDDAHIFLQDQGQIVDEVVSFLGMLRQVYAAFSLDFRAQLGTRPEVRIGTDALWDQAEEDLRQSMAGVAWTEKAGEGAFYGPKIDFIVKDSVGREWQLGTIQLDYNAAERFDLKYTGNDNKEHKPVVIHRAIYGSFERFIAILLEHYNGNLPLWLAPTQMRILTVADRYFEAAEQVKKQLEKHVRVELDSSGEKLGAKIRDSERLKIPYTLIVGDEEVAQNTVAVRRHGAGDLGKQSVDFLLSSLAKELVPPFP